LALADAAEHLDTGDRCSGAIILLKTEHGPSPDLDPAMVRCIRAALATLEPVGES
jgi:hypothetical protein